MSATGIYGLSGSGIDVDSMVKVGMLTKQNEYDRMYKKEVRQEWTKEAYANLYSDLTTFTTSSTVEVGVNPNKVERINDNKLVVTWTGNYGDVAAGCAIIDAGSLTAIPVGHGLTKGAIYGGKVYGYDAPYGGTTSWVVIDANGNVENFPFPVSVDNNAYGININPANGDVYIMDADYSAGGNVYCYRADGTLRFKSAAAMNPSKVVFL